MQSKTKKLLAALIAAGVVPAAHAADLKLGVAEALSGGAASTARRSATASSWLPMKSTPPAASAATRSCW